MKILIVRALRARLATVRDLCYSYEEREREEERGKERERDREGIVVEKGTLNQDIEWEMVRQSQDVKFDERWISLKSNLSQIRKYNLLLYAKDTTSNKKFAEKCVIFKTEQI